MWKKIIPVIPSPKLVFFVVVIGLVWLAGSIGFFPLFI
jgi:hypothetical protein